MTIDNSPDYLITFEQFAHLHGNTVKERTLVRLANEKLFPKFVRISKRSQPMWSAREIREFFEELYSELGVTPPPISPGE